MIHGFRLILISLVLSHSAMVTPCSADSSFDALFHKGNQSFEAGDVELARDAYESIVKAGILDARVFYNLGNCYLKLDDPGRAILSYRRALKIDSHDDDIQANLDLARELVTGTQDMEKKTGLYDLVLSLSRSTGLTALSIVTLVLWWLTCGFFAYGAVSRIRRKRRHAFRLAILSLVCCTICAAGLTVMIHDNEMTVHAVATGQRVIARSGPGDHFSDVFEQKPGYEMIVRRQQSGWSEVILPNGFTGWVPSESITHI